MSRTRKLSLRARMLVMLVGVTTVLLLIMGTVSTYLLANRVDGQAAAVARHLGATATVLASEPTLAAKETGYAAVEVPLRAPLDVVKLNNGKVTTELAGAVSQWLGSESRAEARSLAEAGHLTAAAALLTAGG